MTTYRIEFDHAWPVPPITVDFTDHTAASRQVVAHAIPYLRPVLAKERRLDLIGCFFQPNRAFTGGAFMRVGWAVDCVTRFCPARLTPVDQPAAPVS